jgi:hypothetical protein
MLIFQPPVNFCSDENIQTIFGTKLEDFFKLSDRLQFNIPNCRKSCEKNIFSAPKASKSGDRQVLVEHDQLHSYPLRFYMAVSILNFTCNQMFPFDGHLLATSPQQTTKLQMNLTLTSIN